MNAVAGMLVFWSLACSPPVTPLAPPTPTGSPTPTSPAGVAPPIKEPATEGPSVSELLPTVWLPSEKSDAAAEANSTPAVNQRKTPDGAKLRKTTPQELDALAAWEGPEASHYERVGYIIDAVAEVLPSRCSRLVRISKSFTARLENLPAGKPLEVGQQIRVRAMIVDEKSRVLTLWVYELGDSESPSGAPTASDKNAADKQTSNVAPRDPNAIDPNVPSDPNVACDPNAPRKSE
ncbi:MAG TPA: hypothetical protein VGE52_19325 [Pirellulales bacterium]